MNHLKHTHSVDTQATREGVELDEVIKKEKLLEAQYRNM